MRARIPILLIAIHMFGAACAQAGGPKADVTSAAAMREITVPIFGQFGDHHSFPAIRDWNSLRIGLWRTACPGPCPSYTVQIRGDGTVHYQGKYCVLTKSTRAGHLTHDKIKNLFQAFQRADFFSLRAAYNERVLDGSGIRLTLEYDHKSWSVVDMAETEGLPAQAAALPGIIDSMVNSAHWVGHNSGAHCPKP